MPAHGIHLLDLLHRFKQPGTTGNAEFFQGRGYRQTDGFIGARFICHDQMRIERVQPAFHAFYRRKERFEVDGDVEFEDVMEELTDEVAEEVVEEVPEEVEEAPEAEEEEELSDG